MGPLLIESLKITSLQSAFTSGQYLLTISPPRPTIKWSKRGIQAGFTDTGKLVTRHNNLSNIVLHRQLNYLPRVINRHINGAMK